MTDAPRPLFWYHVLAAGVVLAAIAAVQPLLGMLTEAAAVALNDSLTGVAACAAAFLALRACRRSAGRARAGWLFLGAGTLAWAGGEALWGFYEVVLGIEAPFPSPADVSYLMGYPLLLAGVLHLAMPPGHVARTRTMLDAATFVLVVAVPVWYYILAPIHADSEASLLVKLLSDAYPAGDLLLVFGLGVAALRRWGERDGLLLLVLGCGLSVTLAADLAFAFASLDGTFQTGSILDTGWQAGYALIAFAAFLQLRWQPDYAIADLVLSSPAWRQALPPALLVPLVAWFSVVAGGGGATSAVVVAAGVCLTVLLVVARNALNLADVLALTASLRRSRAELERSNETLRGRSSEMNKLLVEAVESARRDSLTGLLNHAAIHGEVERAMERGSSFGVAMLDIDHMKAVNDSRGHLAGDALLREVARRLSTLEGAVAGRYGGDEFLVVAAAREGSEDLEAALGRAVAELFPYEQFSGRPVYVSAGTAAFPRDGSTSKELIEAADRRLYAAKQAGASEPRQLTA